MPRGRSAFAVAVVSALCATSASVQILGVPTASAGSSSTPLCAAGHSSLRVTPGVPGMGHFSVIIEVTNAGSRTCVLSGAPTVGLLNGAGAQVAAADSSERGPAPPPRLRLGKGEVASAELEGTGVPLGRAPNCPSYPAYTVRLPDSAVSKWFKGPLEGCSTLHATPFVLGFSGLAPSGEVVGTAPACDEKTRQGDPGPFVQVDAWSGGELSGSTTVFASATFGRPFSLTLPPGRYRISSPRSPSRDVVVRAGEIVTLGRYGKCSVSGTSSSTATPSTLPGPGLHATTTTTTTAALSSGTPCTASDLQLKLDRVAPAVMQQPGAFFVFTNMSNSSCHLDGYPSLEPISGTGQIIGTAIRESGNYLISDPGPQTVTLAPGGSAYFGYGWSDVRQPLGFPADCVDTVRVESIPPGGATPLTATAALPSVCPGGFPSVTAVAPAPAFAAGDSPAQP
jgi:hypothetical protein